MMALHTYSYIVLQVVCSYSADQETLCLYSPPGPVLPQFTLFYILPVYCLKSSLFPYLHALSVHLSIYMTV